MNRVVLNWFRIWQERQALSGIGSSPYPPPGVVRIKRTHRLCDGTGARAQILFVNYIFLVHEEGLDARHPVLNRPGHQGKATDHGAVLDIIQLTTARMRPLRRQNPKMVAVIGGRSLSLFAVPFRLRLFHAGCELRWWSFGSRPEEPVACVRRTDQLAGILWYPVLISVLGSVIILSVHIGLTRSDRIQLIRADPPRENLGFSLSRVVMPAAGGPY